MGQQVMPREEEGVWSTGVLLVSHPSILLGLKSSPTQKLQPLLFSGSAWEQVNWERCLTELHSSCMCTTGMEWHWYTEGTDSIKCSEGGEDILFVLQAITKAIRHAERESNLGLKSLAPECSGPKLSFEEAQRRGWFFGSKICSTRWSAQTLCPIIS